MGASPSQPKKFGFTEVVEKGDGVTNGDIRRQRAYKDALRKSSLGNATTLYETWQLGLKAAPNNKAFGTRTINKTVVDGKETTVAGPFVWMTYAEAQAQIDQIGAGILHFGLAPVNDTGVKLIGIFSKNRVEYSLTVQACNAYGLADVPLYDTLGAEAVTFIVGQTNLATVFAARGEVAKLLKFTAEAKKNPAGHGDLSCLKTVVQFEDVTPEERAAAAAAGLTLRSFGEVLEAGAAHPSPHAPPKPSDLAYICYTSGTTGTPKGAMITHNGMVADASGAVDVELDLNPTDVYLSYLPLAHVMERLVQAALTACGASIGFFQGDTLKLMEDIAELRPTVFVSVPRLYNKIYDGVVSKAEAAGGVKAALFHAAFDAKRYWLARNFLKHSLWDRLVFDKVKARVGLDRVRLMVTGSAPLAAHVTEFVRIVFGVPLVEGYGQTECSAAATATSMWDHSHTGHVGTPLACNEIKLVSVPDMGYTVADTVHGREVDADGTVTSAGIACAGRGEVCYRGPNVFTGYYKDAAKTAEVLEADGWLHSGDIGLWDAEGNLRIIDRKKNIFKLSQGEYVAAEKVENIYMKSPFVAQVFVHGDSLHSVLVAIVVPNEAHVAAWAKATPGKEGLTPAAAAADEDFKKAVLADIVRTSKEAKLQSFEIVKAVHLDATPWTPESILTPTFKLKRNDAKAKYAKQIDEMYGRVDAVAGMKNIKQGAA